MLVESKCIQIDDASPAFDYEPSERLSEENSASCKTYSSDEVILWELMQFLLLQRKKIRLEVENHLN